MTAVNGYVQANNYTFEDYPLFKKSEVKWKPYPGTITDILQDHPFIEVIRLGGYESMFGDNNGYFTLFVPIKVPSKDEMDVLYAKNIIRYSTLPTLATIDVIKQRSFLVPLLNGSRLSVYTGEGQVYLNDINDPVYVIRPDVYAVNGIIHYIDRPLEPDPN